MIPAQAFGLLEIVAVGVLVAGSTLYMLRGTLAGIRAASRARTGGCGGCSGCGGCPAPRD